MDHVKKAQNDWQAPVNEIIDTLNAVGGVDFTTLTIL